MEFVSSRSFHSSFMGTKPTKITRWHQLMLNCFPDLNVLMESSIVGNELVNKPLNFLAQRVQQPISIHIIIFSAKKNLTSCFFSVCSRLTSLEFGLHADERVESVWNSGRKFRACHHFPFCPVNCSPFWRSVNKKKPPSESKTICFVLISVKWLNLVACVLETLAHMFP